MLNISRTVDGFLVKLWQCKENFLRNIVSPLSLEYGISVHAKTSISQYLCQTNAMHKFSTSWKFSPYFVYFFIGNWNFLPKFCNSDLSVKRNVLTSYT